MQHAFSLRLIITMLLVAAFVSDDSRAESDDESGERRKAQIETILSISHAAIANPAFLETDDWKEFEHWLRGEAPLQLDDADFRTAFNRAARALPFTHYRLFWRPRQDAGEADAQQQVSFEQAAPGVALLRVPIFETDPAATAVIMGRIIQEDYRDLIIDLRGNEGGSFPSVVALAQALDRNPADAGVFLTRKWFVEHGEYPDAADRAAISPLQTLDLEAFSQQLASDGAVRLVLPPHDRPVFEGRVVVLTDGDTGSASEPFVYMLQKRGIPVIGEPTAGAMLSADRMPVDDTFVLFVPVADYMTADGERLDHNGVTPDITVPAETALEAALELLSEA